MTFRKYVNESIKKMSDDKIDTYIKKEYNGKASTFKYNPEAVHEIAVLLKNDDVIVTKDMKFFHIPEVQDRKINNLINKILIKYNIDEVQ